MWPKGSGITFSRQCTSPRARATVHQHILRMGVLIDYVRYLLLLKDSPNAVPSTKKGNTPFSETNLAAIILASVPIMWQNQYNLTHLTVSKLPCTLLSDLENIEQVMVENHNEKLKAKGKASTACPHAESNPKKKASGGLRD
jgi:hypothetical protein